MQILPEIQNEYGKLRTVVVGVARRMGGAPKSQDCYDARSFESVQNNSYPSEEECMAQLKGVIDVLENAGVQVLRPEVIEDLNQVFARDIAFVIEDQFIIPNVIEDRAREREAMDKIEGNIPSSNIIMMPSMCNAEGGDVIIHNDYVFVGVSSDETFQKFKTARTNYAGMDYLADEFPAKEFKGFELHKDDLDPRKGALHLDCAFQPLGCGALLAPHLFKNESDVKWLMKYFGEENIYICSEEDAYNLCTNVFSISENEVIISGLCSSLKDWLEARQMIVHTVAYDAIVKMGGLLRCSTMPLSRES